MRLGCLAMAFILILIVTGQLYLGVFSGPVEGILMICVIYAITGFCGMFYSNCGGETPVFRQLSPGTGFWDTGILTFTRLDRVQKIADVVPNVGLNESFMIFGAFALAFNILSRLIFNPWIVVTSH